MEKFIQSLPKPVLAILVIMGAIVFIVVTDPPHTVCDTQETSFKENLAGQLFPKVVKKAKLPPMLGRAKEACQLGNSAGSCYEYFSILKKITSEVNLASPTCTPQLFEVAEVKTALTDGLELMVRLAWGSAPPEDNFARLGWMTESDVAVYCKIRNVYLRANGEEAWVAFRRRIYQKLPGEMSVELSDPTIVPLPTKKATEVFSEEEIWTKSLFSSRCDGY